MLVLEVMAAHDTTCLMYVNTVTICTYTPNNQHDHIALANQREYWIADEKSRKRLRLWAETGEIKND